MTDRADGVPNGDDLGLMNHLVIVWRHRWLVFALCLIAVGAAFTLTLITPKVYESTAAIIVSKEGSGGGGFLGGLAAVSGQIPGLSLPSLTPNRDLMVSILKSRTLAQVVVERYKLQERYKARYLEDAVNALRGVTTVTASREGVISVKVEDTDPWQAAEMANFYVAQLDRLVARYGVGEAGRQRTFLTEQLARAKASLDAAGETLRRFQERNRAVVLQEQTRGAIEAAARLKGEIMAVQVQLQVMRSFATDANPEIVALRRRIDEMNRQLAQMQYGDSARERPASVRERRDFTFPLAQVPELGLELARLTRDVTVQETLVNLLTQQLEQARFNEARDLPIVQVLDQAIPAERHSRPRLGRNLAIAGVTSLLLGIAIAHFLEYAQNLRKKPRTT